MMRKILCMLCLVLLVGCSSKQEYDPNQWEIPIDSIKSVTIESKEHGGKILEPFEIPKSEWIRLIETFNNIEYIEKWEDNEVCNFIPTRIIVNTQYGEIDFKSYDLPVICYKGNAYRYDLTHEYGDAFRDIQKKYNLARFLFEQNDIDFVNQWLDKSSGIFHADLSVNKALEALGYEDRIEPNMTMRDILNTYDGSLELNTVVKYENMELKVINIQNNNVTTVIFTWHN